MTRKAARGSDGSLGRGAAGEADRGDPSWFVEGSGEASAQDGLAGAPALGHGDGELGVPRRHATKRGRSTHGGEGRRIDGPRAARALSQAGPAGDGGVFDAIELRYKQDGHWENLIEMYLQRLELAGSQRDKAQLFRRIAAAFRDGMGDDLQAFEALIEAFRIDPHDEAGVLAVEKAARELSRFQDLVAAVATIAIDEKDDVRALCVCEHAVRWCRDELMSSESAEIFLARIRKVDPSHSAVHRRLASMYRDNGVWDAQRESLSRALLRASNASERLQLHMALAEVEEDRFEDYRAAAVQYEAALTLDPDATTAMAALRGLERIAEAEQRFPQVGLVLERQLDVAQGDDRAATLVRLASLNVRHFMRPQVAAPYLEQALDIVPGDGDALDLLERCYHAMRDFDGLAETIFRRAATEADTDARIGQLARLAEVHESKRRDPDAAAHAYREILKHDDANARALTALARLAERSDDWQKAATHKTRLAELAGSTQARGQLHVAIADMLLAPGRDPDLARQHYERAVAADPSNVNAWEALQKLAEAARDDSRVAYCLAKRAAAAPSPRSKAQLYVELAQHLETVVQDAPNALATYETALRHDPTNEASAAALIDSFVQASDWARVASLAEVLLVAAMRDGATGRAFDLLCLSTRAAAGLGENERALRSALRAFEMRPRDVDAQRALLHVCHRVRDNENVLASAREALAQLSSGAFELSADDLVALADVELARNDEEAATRAYSKALALDGLHDGALGGIANVYAARGDFTRAATFKNKQARATKDATQKFDLLVEAAELWAHRARNFEKATLAFEDARALKPTDSWLLHTLVWIYGETEKWDALVLTLRAIVDQETEAEKRAKTLYALAQVVRDKLHDRARAAGIFEEVLDADATRLDAFERVVRIHTERKDWDALAVAYRAMIGRVQSSTDVDLKYALFHQLGLVLRDRLCQRPRALEAFTSACRLRPQSDEDRKIVAELLVSLNQISLAVAATRDRIAQNFAMPEGYMELAELFLRQKQFDRAWCAIDVLAHLGAIAREHQDFHAAYAPMSLDDVPGTLAPSAWGSHVLHPALDKGLTDILRITTAAMRRARAASFGEAEKRALGQPLTMGVSATGDLVFSAFQNASEIFGTPMPLLFPKRGTGVPFVAAPAHATAFYVDLEAVSALPPDIVPFLAGKRLAELRPALAPRAFFQTHGELKQLLALAVRMASTEASRGVLKPSEAAVLLAMSTEERAELRAVVDQATKAHAAVDLRLWLGLTDLSTTRAALLLVGNVDLAVRGLSRDGHTASDLPSAERRRDLFTFAVSDEHHELRAAIGIAVEV